MKTGGLKKLTLGLLVSATLGFAQMAGTQAPAGPMQGPQAMNYPGGPGSARTSGVRAVTPGTINYLEGQAMVDGQPLSGPGQAMQPGQTLATGNGFAEVLLTPGAFLRIGHDSQVRLVNAGLAETKAQLDRGTAIVEVDQLIKGTNLAVAVNGATARLEKRGLYDFDAGRQAVKVLDGKVSVTEPAGSKSIGKGDELMLASAKPLKSRSFDESAAKSEPLYVWSEARSQDESQANVSMAQNVAAYGGWYGPGWYWDPYWSFYAYLPADGFLYSPFGWGFYSPWYVGYYGVPYGYYGHYGHYGYRGGWHGHVSGLNAHVSSFGGGFHGGGFGGGFHGGGGRR
ncbi:MAG: FecR domain-containing protein [Acidobacteriaceae bacterium]|nr:FecR domain-containing protein [Acidobacteriaceae bacterium]